MMSENCRLACAGYFNIADMYPVAATAGRRNEQPWRHTDGTLVLKRTEHFDEGELESDICWQAIRSRDRRFDGRFFVAAVTTGVYCRSICPVPFAKPNNISLYPSAAAAEAEGFRPCRRCRPETSPGTPAWIGPSAVVSRALRLMREGALNDGDVETLAERLGIGSRQLRRLFVQYLGASPVKIASTHRVHFARNLIEETDLPMSMVALNAGFKSIRQFNHAIRTTSGQSPSELRRSRDSSLTAPRQSGLVIRLNYRPPLNWAAMISFLESRATPGVEFVEEGSYRRTIAIGGNVGMIEIRPDQEHARLTVRIELPGYDGLMTVVERVRRIFDLGADPLQIASHLSRDPALKPLLDERPGLRVPGVWDDFELVVKAILGYRLSVIESNALAGQLVSAFGKPVETPVERLTHLFPQPDELADADLSRVGIAAERAVSIRAVARLVLRKQLTFESARSLPETISRLTTIPGISVETAHYIAMRAFGEPDAFPSQDLGIVDKIGCLEGRDRLDGLPITEVWRPWRAYAAMHLWAADEGRLD
jgi:AraC family transcriptional regulator, regulatory protein of adaptative response / DNA-3-methyladenine glycosylase II